MSNTSIHDFINVFHEVINEKFPDTKRYLVASGDFIQDMVIELREGDKRLRYSPYELFKKSEDYECAMEQVMKQWEDMLKKK